MLVSIPLIGDCAAGRRIALVIGNGAYKNAPLRNPANDDSDISRALKRLGFQVTVLRDAGQRKMEDSIRAFGKEFSVGGVGLFYYAGHGMQVEGRNYLIPVDARIESPSDVKYESIDDGRVLGKMEDAGNDMNIVILDACRDNPFSRSLRSTQKGLARMDAPKGSYVAYATAPGSVAADGSGRNGTYTNSLLRHIELPGLTLESVMKRVRKDVINETGSKQVPWASTSLVGEFYFNSASTKPKRGLAVQKHEPLQKSTQTLNAEEEMWKIVQSSSSIEDFNLCLDEYPNSRFRGAARLKIQQLKRKQNAQNMIVATGPAVTNKTMTTAIRPENKNKAMTAAIKQEVTGNKLAAIDRPKVPNKNNSMGQIKKKARYKLSLYPVKIFSNRGGQTSMYEEATIQGIELMCEVDDKLDLITTYKYVKGLTNTAKLMSDLLGSEQIGVWEQRSLLSKSEPNWDQISMTNSKIGADLAVLVYLSAGTAIDVNVYLYDFKTKKVYSSLGRANNDVSVHNNIGEFTSNLLEEFYSDQSIIQQ